MTSLIKLAYRNLHWILTAFLLVYTIVPFLSPIFFETGHTQQGWWIQTIYRFLCHQRPERSLFLFGEHITYSLDELTRHGYTNTIIGYPFIGNPVLGYKVAFCVRDTFMYGSMAIAGILISAIPKKIEIKWWMLVLAGIPIALDGITQFISEFLFLAQGRFDLELASPFYLSNNINRAVTGIIFGFVVGLFVFSELKDAVASEDPFKS